MSTACAEAPRASLRVTATISAALSPPELESPRHRPHPAPRISAYLPQLRFTELDSCRVAVSSTRVTLRSVASAPLLQSPVQRAGRAGRLSEPSPYASVHESRDERLVLTFTSYIKKSAAAWLRVLPRRRRPLRRPVRPCRATRRDTELRRTLVALHRVRPGRAPRGDSSQLALVRRTTLRRRPIGFSNSRSKTTANTVREPN